MGGRTVRCARGLGLYAAEVEDAIVVAGLAEQGPANKAGLRPGDRIVAVRDDPVASLAGFWRKVWAGGPAGSEIQLQVSRDGENLDGARPVRRPHPVSQGAKAALTAQIHESKRINPA